MAGTMGLKLPLEVLKEAQHSVLLDTARIASQGVLNPTSIHISQKQLKVADRFYPQLIADPNCGRPQVNRALRWSSGIEGHDVFPGTNISSSATGRRLDSGTHLTPTVKRYLAYKIQHNGRYHKPPNPVPQGLTDANGNAYNPTTAQGQKSYPNTCELSDATNYSMEVTRPIGELPPGRFVNSLGEYYSKAVDAYGNIQYQQEIRLPWDLQRPRGFFRPATLDEAAGPSRIRKCVMCDYPVDKERAKTRDIRYCPDCYYYFYGWKITEEWA
ncbi:unnamed protein product [Nezara viridula]|uniref:Uncharacterized protein n=1 Tax=Nezara viridula TaxID=85310 RepID=A0A9P0E8X1_NEZVI|nr:unnamed protein product [Nezara viridula]